MQNSSLNFTRKYLYATTTNQHLQITNNQQNPTVYNSYTYDSAGNMLTSNADRSYSWDAFGRLRTFQIASRGSVTKFAHYIYDAGGSRTKKLIINQQGNYESVTYIDGVMEYHRKVTLGNVEEKNYLSLQGGVELRIGGYTGDMSQSEVYTISDYLSSGGTRLDSSGAVIDSEEYYPYGESSLTTYGKKRYRYTGKEKDEESGLYYMAARYYCCSSAKFISVDPLAGKYAHQSSYCYADCNPVMKNDPSGMGTGDSVQRPTNENGGTCNNCNSSPAPAKATGTNSGGSGTPAPATNPAPIQPPKDIDRGSDIGPQNGVNRPKAEVTANIKVNPPKITVTIAKTPLHNMVGSPYTVPPVTLTKTAAEWAEYNKLRQAGQEKINNPDIVTTDFYGNTVIGPQMAVETRIGFQRVQYQEQMRLSLTGGIAAPLVYMSTGDELKTQATSALVDGLLMGLGGGKGNPVSGASGNVGFNSKSTLSYRVLPNRTARVGFSTNRIDNNASGFLSQHAYNKHAFNSMITSTRNRTQYGEGINVAYITYQTINRFDKMEFKFDLEGNHYSTVYKKEFPFNISTSESPTSHSRVIINHIDPTRSSNFPKYIKQ